MPVVKGLNIINLYANDDTVTEPEELLCKLYIQYDKLVE